MQFLNWMFYGDYLRYKEDSFFGRQIMLTISQNGINYRKKALVFLGSRKLDSSKLISKVNSGGKSFFEDSSQYYRMPYFIGTLGYSVIVPTAEEMGLGKSYGSKMPSWPEAGSIKELDDVIIIKLSSY